jgi:hypothetical protein
MAMNNLSTVARDAACDGIVDQVDTGGGTAHVRIYTAAFGTLLAELDFPATAFGASSSGTATAGTIVDEASAPAGGTAAVCRIVDKAGSTVWEGTVGSGSGDIDLNTTTITLGDSVSISSMTVTMPAS